MIPLLTTYAVPLIGTAILALFAKPNKDKPPIWRRFVDLATKPTTTTTTTNTPTLPQEILSILPMLLEQLLRKAPPPPDQPLPVTVDTKSPQDIVAYIMSLLGVPTQPPATINTTDVTVSTPVTHEDRLASLVASANALASSSPEFDYCITITVDGGVKVEKKIREKADANAQSK